MNRRDIFIRTSRWNAPKGTKGRHLVSKKEQQWYDFYGNLHNIKEQSVQNAQTLLDNIKKDLQKDFIKHEIHTKSSEAERDVTFITDTQYSFKDTDFTEYTGEKLKSIHSKKLEREGISFEKQDEIIDILKRANERGEEIKEETNGVLSPKFSLNLQRLDIDQLTKRVEAAIKVLDPDYITKYAIQEKINFVDNFSNHIEIGDKIIKDLFTEVQKIDNYLFVKFLKISGLNYLSYALESIIDKEGYDMIRTFMKSMTKTLRKINKLNK